MTVAHGRRRSAALIATVAVPIALLMLLRKAPGLDVSNQSVHFHLFVVSSIAVLAAITGFVAGAAAVRVRQPGVVLLAAGCMLCGTLMAVHGLVTPGVHGTRYNLWVSRAPLLAVLAFALCQCAATFATTTPVGRWIGRHARLVLGSLLVACIAFGYAIVTNPSRAHGVHPVAHETGLGDAILVVAVCALLPSAARHWRRYRLGGDGLQAALAVAATLSIAAVFSMRFGKLWHLSWWDYHLYLLIAFGAVVATIFVRYRKARRVAKLLETTFAVDPMEHIAGNYPEALERLVAAVEQKDIYTHGHSRRTAHVATALGVKLRLAPEQLRVLAQGAYLHDVGKIAIPDEILNKPGRLTAEERGVIEEHSEIGAQMVQEDDALLPCVEIVRHHHERYDGAGYPVGVRGDEIPLLARVTAVADVWDALTSDRAYRPGWDPSDALAHIVAASGTHFDPTVVAALVELASEWGYRIGSEDSDDSPVERSLQDCHESRDSRVPEMAGSSL